MAVVWRARALADIDRSVRYIATDNPIAARRVGRELLLAGDSLVTFPRRGRPGRQPGTRELAALPPYIIVYRIAGPPQANIASGIFAQETASVSAAAGRCFCSF